MSLEEVAEQLPVTLQLYFLLAVRGDCRKVEVMISRIFSFTSCAFIQQNESSVFHSVNTH